MSDLVQYPRTLTLAEGLALYLARYNLGDGGYDARWFYLPLFGLVSVPLPNIRNRAQAVRYHDLHHVITEYATGFKGEAEIGAWEVASGCGRYYSAWILNIGAMLYGVPRWPRAVFRAFVRGRRSRNFYHNTPYDLRLLETPIGDSRDLLRLPTGKSDTRPVDFLLFAIWLILPLIAILGLPSWIIATQVF